MTSTAASRGTSAVDSQQIAKEKFDKLGGMAQQHGKEAAEKSRRRYSSR